MSGDSTQDVLDDIPIRSVPGGMTGTGAASRHQAADDRRPLFSRRRTPPKKKKRRPLLLILLPALCLGLYAACGYSLVPWLLKTAVPQALSRALNRPVTLRAAAFDPFTLELRLENGIIGPDLANPDDQVDPVLAFDRLFLDIEFRSLLAGALVTRTTTLDRLFIHVVRGAGGDINLHALLPKPPPGEREKRPFADMLAALPLPFSLGNLHLAGGRMLFDDRISGKIHVMEHIRLSMPVVVSDPALEAAATLASGGRVLSPRFSATVNGSPIDLTGESRVEKDAWTAIMKVDLKEFNLATLLATPDSGKEKKGLLRGTADLNGSLVFSASSGGSLALTFSGGGTVKDLLFADGEDNTFGFASATFSGTFEPLLHAYRFRELTLANPGLRVARGKDGAWRWPLPLPSPGRGTVFDIDALTVRGGTFALKDQVTPGGSGDLSDVELSIQGLTMPSRTRASYTLEAKAEGNAAVKSQGVFTLAPFRLDGDFKVSGAETASLTPLRSFLPEGMKPAGRLANLSGRYSIQAKEGEEAKAWFLTDLAFALEDFSLAMGGERWLHLPFFALRQGMVNSEERTVDLGVGEGEADILLHWDRGGKLNWELFGKTAAPGEASAPGWTIGLTSLSLKQTTVSLESGDEEAAKSLRLDNLNATAGALSSRKDAQGTVSGSAALNGKGYIGFGGYLTLSPPGATLQCDIADIPVDSLAPFLKTWLLPQVTSGILQARGDFKLPEGRFAGLAAVTDFSATAGGRKAMGFTRAIARDMSFGFAPPSLDLKALSLERPYLLWQLPAEGGSSLARLFTPPEGGAAKQDAPPPLSIAEIQITEGALDFHDATVTPAYQTGIASVNGIITGLAATPGNRAVFALQGRAGDRATISLKGPFGFFDQDLFMEADIEATGFDMPAIAPYTEPALGYRVDRGTLDLTTRYRLHGAKAEADNTLRITGLKTGKRLDGALALPLTLALHANRQGEIVLDLPLSGPAKEPSFSFRTSLNAGLRNLLLKAAVSPFSVLSPLLPGQNALRYESLVFPYGSSELNGENRELLKDLVKVFEERPGLRLRLRGMADAKGDRDAIAAERTPTPAPGGKQPPAVKDEELLRLAGKRAAVVRTALVSLGMRSEQLSIDAKAMLVSPEDAGGKRGNRVAFLLEPMNE